ncbi:M20/M25/M40 family metallo-hydrolase [Desulfurivibrio alkaliphilus]|uniref:Peptidase T-like protein n=1 Tax=Desulfurivibrio alkaliphilus (strain DSM 19089 / UNIQEM U267 / AHT2) TaxID=589865 RepID=D6Z5F0_DESAT|nr:M20/M25/M40 family metallo-hydrolase [Desulfurivibrio alkaliphilus]ADH86687.1 peptidase T-like protein [Desulfurivibrio alkaliphilus AHT 2]
MSLQPERLAEIFVRLCEIDSPSRQEGRVAAFLKGLFATEFNAEILEDNSAPFTGSDTGNLVIRIPGRRGGLPPFFCNCHLDVVEPACGVKVRRQGETFTSAGATVLGADDKAGIAMLVEMARSLKEDGLLWSPLEFVFTTCEEIGLLGAKNFDFSLLRADTGYALDSAGFDLAVVAAPAANHFTARVHGLAAHAGLHPETGINAIQLASRALADLSLGRLDDESTANIGVIAGGKATNIVPDLVTMEGEVRSHDPDKLAHHTQHIKDVFHRTVSKYGSLAPTSGPPRGAAEFSFTIEEQFPAMKLKQGDPVLQRLRQAADQLRRRLEFTVAGGGSDANIFSAHGFPTAILGTGMTDVHTTDESVTLTALVRTTELLLAMYRLSQND